MVSVNGRMLQKFSCFGASIEFGFGQESVIFAVNFAGACGSGRARNRVNELGGFSQCVHERGLAGTGWCGKNKQNSVTAKAATQGFEFAREFFPARLCRQRRVAKSRRHSLWPRACSIHEKSPG